jgi:hypothetical protein
MKEKFAVVEFGQIAASGRVFWIGSSFKNMNAGFLPRRKNRHNVLFVVSVVTKKVNLFTSDFIVNLNSWYFGLIKYFSKKLFMLISFPK